MVGKDTRWSFCIPGKIVVLRERKTDGRIQVCYPGSDDKMAEAGQDVGNNEAAKSPLQQIDWWGWAMM